MPTQPDRWMPKHEVVEDFWIVELTYFSIGLSHGYYQSRTSSAKCHLEGHHQKVAKTNSLDQPDHHRDKHTFHSDLTISGYKQVATDHVRADHTMPCNSILDQWTASAESKSG